MKTDRRGFLRAAAGAVVTSLPQRGQVHARRDGCLAPTKAPVLGCALLDLEAQCCLPESLAGYEAALAEARVDHLRAIPGSLGPCKTIIVPGTGAMGSSLAQELVGCVEDGAILLLESAAGFLTLRQFDAHRKQLGSHFGVVVGSPVDLWAQANSNGRPRVPYVDYVWPCHLKVRDFSRVVQVSRKGHEVIGWADGLPVALKRRVGKGTLVFLGSPMGPALRAGDCQARQWLIKLLG